ncbi:nucleotide disphospho-sugar-binding domain-containing protein [Streptomyces goshikiensis]|uniref:nucleotide disphospho-sugar-binding domain-containing protein n=1 Tax=Streptomyces goshikiensis TaxID=1942 RepID=UPI0036D17CFC
MSAGAEPAVSAQDEVAVEALAEQVSRTLLGGLGACFDLVADFTRRLPAQVLAEFLGLPAARRGRFEELLAGCARSLDSRLCPQTLDITRTGLGAAAELLWGPDVIGQARERFLEAKAQQAPEHREDPMAEWLGWTLERLGLPAAGDGLEELLNGQWVIDPGPKSVRLDLREPILPMRFVPYNGPAVVPDWLSEQPKRPRVCLTQGVSGRETHGKDIVRFQDLLTALNDLDIEIVATLDSTQRENLTEVPDNVRIVDFISMDVLLPSCAAIIYHGGAGTSATALLHGVPQIVIGAHWDVPVRARQLDDLGAGIFIRPEDLDAATLRAAVRRVLTEPSLQQTADRLRAEMRSNPTPAETVPVLERLTQSHRQSR